MSVIVLDLEWNGAYCKAVGGYFNEIIEIGAVRLGDNLAIVDRFDAVIRPRVSRKLSRWVTDLTGYTDEQLKVGTTFADAMEGLSRFVGDGAVVLTWSTTDLLVFMENCRYYYGSDTLPFMAGYLDLQAYAQTRLGLGTAQQVALVKFAELLGMNSDELALHHAIDDSVLSAQILQRVYDAPSFEEAVRTADAEFYRRITFKPSYVSEWNDPAVAAADFQFDCEVCHTPLKGKKVWQFRHRAFETTLRCPRCGERYTGRVQLRRFYEGVQVKRRLVVKPKPQETEETQSTVSP